MQSNSSKAWIRTPEECFSNLPGYDFKPNYLQLQGLRLHYLDEGPLQAEPILLLHGEPSWSYLYRKMIPPLVAGGHRVIAPDLIGFGRSDKLIKQMDYSYHFHIEIISAFIQKIKLSNITLFCQDWGGLIGLRVAMDHPQLFKRIIAANTLLPGFPQPLKDHLKKIPKGLVRKSKYSFGIWFLYSQLVPSFNAGKVLQMGTRNKINKQVLDAYNAPFPDRHYQAGARVFPRLVGSNKEENKQAWIKLNQWQKPFLTAFSTGDPITSHWDVLFQSVVPGAKGQPHVKVKGAGHFLQEDKGEELAKIILEFINRN